MDEDEDKVTPEQIEEHQRHAQNSRAYQIWAYSETGHDLTVEEQMFVRSYVIDRNDVAAMRRIGYVHEDSRTLKRRAERMLASAEVQDAIKVQCERLMQALDITAERVNQRVAQIAFFDPGQVMEWDHNGVKMMHSKFWTEGQRANVASVKMGKEGIEIRLADRQKALDFLGKQLNLVDDDAERMRQAAAAAAEAAVGKVAEVVQRMRRPLPKPDPKDEPRVVN